MERIEKLKDFLAANPGDCFIQHALALEYVKLGREEEAKHLFQNILASDPGYIGSYYHLARLLERAGDKDAAIQCYEKGMKMAKDAADQHSYNELRSAYDDLLF
jgi:Tfp pilus assembly protein PilF